MSVGELINALIAMLGYVQYAIEEGIEYFEPTSGNKPISYNAP